MVDKSFKTAAALGAAALAVSSHEALAQDVTSSDAWKVSVEGGLLRSDFANQANDPAASNKLGQLNAKEKGYFGAVSIGRELSPGVSWRLSAAFNAFKTAKDSASNPFAASASSDDIDYQTVDFDIGTDYKNNGLDGRGFAGLRFLHSRDKSGYGSTITTGGGKLGSTDTLVAGQKSRFVGIGPRAGADFFFGDAVGLAGGLSGAVLGGYRKSSSGVATVSEGKLGTVTNSSGKSKNGFDWAANFSAYAGVGFRPSAETFLSVGYKVDAWWNIRGKTNGTLDRERDIVSHGPYLKVQVTY